MPSFLRPHLLMKIAMNTIQYSLQELMEISKKLKPHEKLKKCKDHFLALLTE